MNTIKRTVVAVSLVLSGAVFAQETSGSGEPGETMPAPPAEKPTSEQIQAFWKYYFKGKGGGPALADAKLCLELVKEGDDKNECAKEVPAEGVKAGSTVQVWQAYLVPQGGKLDGVIVQSKLNDQVRETRDVTFKTDAIRTRNWTTFRVAKPGTWTFEIKDGDQTLKSLQVKVN